MSRFGWRLHKFCTSCGYGWNKRAYWIPRNSQVYLPLWNRTRFGLGIDEYFIHKRDFGISFGRISIFRGALTSLFFVACEVVAFVRSRRAFKCCYCCLHLLWLEVLFIAERYAKWLYSCMDGHCGIVSGSSRHNRPKSTQTDNGAIDTRMFYTRSGEETFSGWRWSDDDDHL